MLKFAPYVIKTLVRHGARTLLTASGAAVALFVFCIISSLQQGLADLGKHQEAKQTLVAFQANKFCPATSHLPQDYDRKIAKLRGVKDVVPIQVFTNNCRASLDIIVFYGLPPKKVRQVRDFRLLSGSWDEFERNQDAAVIGRAVAQRRDKGPGDKFNVGEYEVTVVGVYASDNPAEENYVYTHLDYLQRRRSQNLVGTVTQLEIYLEPGVDPQAKSKQIDELFRGGPVATDTRPKGVFQAQALGDLAQLIELSHYLGMACLGLVLVLVMTTTVMAVQDRVQEHAVLQTLGFSGPRVFGLVLSESVVISTVGGGLGVGLAMAALSWSGLAVGAEAVTIPFEPSWELAGIGLGVSILTGLAAGFFPAWQAARAEIVPALRQMG